MVCRPSHWIIKKALEILWEDRDTHTIRAWPHLRARVPMLPTRLPRSGTAAERYSDEVFSPLVQALASREKGRKETTRHRATLGKVIVRSRSRCFYQVGLALIERLLL